MPEVAQQSSTSDDSSPTSPPSVVALLESVPEQHTDDVNFDLIAVAHAESSATAATATTALNSVTVRDTSPDAPPATFEPVPSNHIVNAESNCDPRSMPVDDNTLLVIGNSIAGQDLNSAGSIAVVDASPSLSNSTSNLTTSSRLLKTSNIIIINSPLYLNVASFFVGVACGITITWLRASRI
ncbi:hypothetical protein BDR26DRAFT_858215 [Obelidium mucronatum]|nr:hypothetical protein BDR26DRAFT_858215 [Obelidium mucronatum]